MSLDMFDNFLTKNHFSTLEKFLRRTSKMGMTVEQPETLGGKYVDKPGIYHAVLVGVDENPATREGQPLDGVQATFSMLSGTNPDQRDKSIDVMMWNPRPDDEEKAKERARKVQTAFCLATCLIGQFQPGVKATVEPTDAIGRQVVLKLRWRQKKNDTTGEWEDTDRLELSFSDIFHVDDEWVAKNHVPLDPAAIALIPAELRKIKKEAPSLADNAAAASAVDIADV